jgi:glycine betaine catabolism B
VNFAIGTLCSRGLGAEESERGIGVTPFRSMIKYATHKQLPLKIVMFDSNRNRENDLFKKEFDNCATVNKNLKIVYSISDDEQ